jgi:hypothetical protein
VVAYGLHYQSLASQDESEVVQDGMAIRIFFQSLWLESIWMWTGVQLGETLTHSYYNLDYIKLRWGGAEEQGKKYAAGNKDAKNWQDKACKVIKKTVSVSNCCKSYKKLCEHWMEAYY